MIAESACLEHVTVDDAEYRRLLGYPRNHVIDVRARALMGWARSWYAAHGRPWMHLAELQLAATADGVRIEGPGGGAGRGPRGVFRG